MMRSWRKIEYRHLACIEEYRGKLYQCQQKATYGAAPEADGQDRYQDAVQGAKTCTAPHIP